MSGAIRERGPRASGKGLVKSTKMADMMVMDPRSVMAKIAGDQRLRSSPKTIYE